MTDHASKTLTEWAQYFDARCSAAEEKYGFTSQGLTAAYATVHLEVFTGILAQGRREGTKAALVVACKTRCRYCRDGVGRLERDHFVTYTDGTTSTFACDAEDIYRLDSDAIAKAIK